MKRILIIKMWAIGDILMATPMLNAIRASEPDAHIAWLVDVFHADVLANHPLIDELIVLDSGQWRRLLRNMRLPAWIRRTRELNAQMKARKFDVVINCFPEKWWTRFLCVAPVTVGVFPSPTVPATGRFYTHAIPKPKGVGLHNTDQFLLATAAAGFPAASKKMSVGESADEQPFYEEFKRTHGLVDERMTVVIAPFSTADNRSIDREFTVRVADWVALEYGAQVIITCGPNDGEKAKEMSGMAKTARIVAAEGTSLREYIALLRNASLVITGDSSPMHLAAAAGTPYVALFGPTPVEERAPLDGCGVALVKPLHCAPCDLPTCSNRVFQECMKLIELGDVQKGVREVLEKYGPAISRTKSL